MGANPFGWAYPGQYYVAVLTVSGVGAVASGATFGTTKAVRWKGPGGVASSVAFGTTKGVRWVGPAGLATAAAFGRPVLNKILAQGVASAETVGTAKAVRWIGPAGVASAQAFGRPVLNSVRPQGIASAEAFGVTAARRLEQPVGVPPAEAFGTQKAVRHVGPAGVGSAAAFGQPAAQRQLAASGVVSVTSFGVQRAVRWVGPAGFSGAGWGTDWGSGWGEQFGQNPATQRRIGPAGIASATVFGSSEALQDWVEPVGIPSAQTLGTAKAVRYVGAAGVSAAEAVGQPTFIRVTAIGVQSAEMFGTATVAGGSVVVAPVHLGPLRIVDYDALRRQQHERSKQHKAETARPAAKKIAAQGVVSAEQFGRPAVAPGLVSPYVLEALRRLAVNRRRRLPTGSIASAAHVSAPSVLQHARPSRITARDREAEELLILELV